jgi:glycosyltransferase involved in cell wall biosynthesis
LKPKLNQRVLFLTTSAQANPAAGGRTRVVSEQRYALLDLYQVTILCLVPPRQWVHPVRCFQARRALQRDARCPVCYWPALPAFGRFRLQTITTAIHTVAVWLFAVALRVRGIHAHGQGAAAIALLTRRMGLRCWVIFDAHGVGPEEYAFSAPKPDPRWIAQLEREEKAVLSSADEVVCVSGAMQEHYREKYKLEGDRWSVVPCATSATVGWDARTRAHLRRALKLEDRFVFVYAGSYRKYQMADEMVELFRAVKQDLKEAYFLIFTGDRDRFEVAARAGGLTAEDYRIVSLSHEEVLQTLPAADVGFLLRADSPVNRVASPTKFAEYCICGVPVLLTPYVGDYSRVVEEEQLGFCLSELRVSPRLLHFLRDVQAHREAIAACCHHYASQHLTWTSAGTTLRQAYERLSSARPGH